MKKLFRLWRLYSIFIFLSFVHATLIFRPRRDTFERETGGALRVCFKPLMSGHFLS